MSKSQALNLECKFRIVALCGNVSSGKDTLAHNLVMHYGLRHESSDGIREEISGNIGGASRGTIEGKSFDVWYTMNIRAIEAFLTGQQLLLNSTGMSKHYCEMIQNLRDARANMCVIKLSCDESTWKLREKNRTDRWKLQDGQKVAFQMPERAFKDSSNVDIVPDLFIDTTNLTTDEVFDRVSEFIRKSQ